MLKKVFQIFDKAEAAKVWQSVSNCQYDNATVKGAKSGIYDPHSRKSGICGNIPVDISQLLNRADSIFRANVEDKLQLQGWQLLRYNVGDKFNPHIDSLQDEPEYHRKYTALVCFQSAIQGGDTVFTETNERFFVGAGQMLVWQNMSHDGRVLQESMHTGSEVIEGTKYVAVAWYMMPERFENNGYGYLPNVLSEIERQAAIESIKNTALSDEGSNEFYNHSAGMSNIPYCEGLLAEKKAMIESFTGLKLERANSYARIYKNGNKMAIHTDREGLDVTVSIALSNGFYNELCLVNRNGQQVCGHIRETDGFVLKGRELQHYRRPIEAEESQEMIMLFLHYTIV